MLNKRLQGQHLIPASEKKKKRGFFMRRQAVINQTIRPSDYLFCTTALERSFTSKPGITGEHEEC